jgi:UrcA family protein
MNRFAKPIVTGALAAVITTSLLTATLLVITMQSARAQGAAGEPAQRIVRYGDLDLTQQTGTAILLRRLQSASRSVCSALDDSQLAHRDALRACEARALADAVHAVNSAQLTELAGSPFIG